MTTFITVTEMVCCYDHLSTNLHIPQKECEVYEELLLKHLRPYCTTTSMDEDGIDVEDAHNTIDEVCNTKAHLRNIVGGMEELLAVLRTHEEHTLQTLRYIALREDVMERLRVCCEFFDGGGCVLDDAQANFLLLLQEHQMLTLLVVESITQWQLTLRYAAPFVWRCGGGGGAELYMHRILADCAALTYTNVCKSLQIRLTQQPLCANMHLQQVAHRKMLMRRTKMVNSGALWSKGLQPVVPPVHDGVRRYYDVLCCFSGPLAAKNLRDARHGSMAIRHAPTHDADAVDDDDDDGVVGVAPPLLHGWRPSKNHMARKRKHERLAHAEELLLQEPARVEQMQAELHMLEHTCGGIAMLLATDDLIHVRAESSSVHTNTDTFPRTFTANTSMWSLNEELCNHIYVARHGRGRGRREQQSQSQHRDVVHEAATRSMVSASATPTTNSATNNTRRSSITSSSSSSIVASSSTTSATLPDAPTPTTTTTTKAADVRRGSLSSSSLLSSSLSANTSTKMEEDVPPPEHPNTARVAASHPSSRASSSSSRTSSLSHTKTPLSFISSSTQSPAPSSPASSARGETNVVEERRSISLEELRRQLLEEHSQSM